MRRNSRQYVATVCHGNAQTLKAPESDVSVCIPDGVYTVLQGCSHTDHTSFADVIPDDEYLIAPVPEFCAHTLQNQEDKANLHFIVRIPHCTYDKSCWDYIKVRYGDLYGDTTFTEIQKYQEDGKQEVYYDIDERFITIHTTHFTDFTCSIRRNPDWPNLVLVFLFGSVTKSEGESYVTLRLFLCSLLHLIRDYVVVGFNSF